MYKAKYTDYDDENLFDKYVRLFKAMRFRCSDNEEDAIRFSAVKGIMGKGD